MHLAIVFLLVTAIGLIEMVLIEDWGWLLLWPTLCYFGVALAYAGAWPRLFGKRPDGSLSPFGILFFLPFLLFAWVIWHLHRLFLREPACQLICPGLWLGRRPFPKEVPPSTMLIVDMTAEFAESAKIRTGRDYLTLPTLDGYVPSAERLRQLVEEISAYARGDVLVHCAAGYGRSAMVVACVLIARGLARDVAEAERMMKAIRPRVGLSRAQRKRVEEFAGSQA